MPSPSCLSLTQTDRISPRSIPRVSGWHHRLTGWVMALSLGTLLVAGCRTTPQGRRIANGGDIATRQQLGADQNGAGTPAPYRSGPRRGESERLFRLVHTRLELEPIWERSQLKGTATVTLAVHYQPQNVLRLDAKGMEVYTVNRILGKTSKPLVFENTGRELVIQLDSTYRRGRQITLEIDYLAKPEELGASSGLKAISSDKGLYFINPRGTVPGRTRQLWTQGEPEANSVWFPTIDSPNQKMTQEIELLVDTSLVTLSNGELVYSTKVTGGKRRDLWEMKLPHAPYLAMIAVGEFAVVRDQWRGKELSYYVEKPFAGQARAIFGRTPAMMEFYSRIFQFPYPWAKYGQIIVRDYVSGAMENTTATIHNDGFYGVTDRTRLDGDQDETIAHELIHHWFGDLVTAESWGELTINESFANYGEYLWIEHSQGRDAAQLHHLIERYQYLAEAQRKQEPLVRRYFRSPNDMFDSHSYAKGGRILHMLRRQLGDSAFFDGLRLFLRKHQFAKAEAQELRLAFEQVTGQDLTWFFDQWYFSPGHALLRVRKTWDGEKLLLSVAQVQDSAHTPVYRLQLEVDTWINGLATRHNLTTLERDTTFEIPLPAAPQLVQIDPDMSLLAQIDYQPPLSERQATFELAPQAIERVLVLRDLLSQTESDRVNQTMARALRDSAYIVRQTAIELAPDLRIELSEANRNTIKQLATRDPKSAVRLSALGLTAQLRFDGAEALLRQGLADPSFMVQAEALTQLIALDPSQAEGTLARMESSTGVPVLMAVAELGATVAQPGFLAWYEKHLYSPQSEMQMTVIKSMGEYASRVKDAQVRDRTLTLLEQLSLHANDSRTIRAGLRRAVTYLPDEPRMAPIRQKVSSR